MVCFFFNDPATSEFYTYGHSLCLHDARPISVDAVVPGVAGAEAESASVEAETATQVTYEQRGIVSGDTLWDIAADELGDGARYRSEEHTSELQSQMRSSYAVFCLQKKTTNKDFTTRDDEITTSTYRTK